MWLANALTAARIPFAIGFWITYGTPAWSAVWVAAAAVSDALDGRVARWARARAGVSESAASIGAVLDPAADKLFVVIALAAIVAHDRDSLPLIACVAARELVMIPLVVGYWIAHCLGAMRTIELRAHMIGKAATVVQFVALAAIATPELTAARWPLAIAGGVLGLAAVVEQATRIRTARRPEP